MSEKLLKGKNCHYLGSLLILINMVWSLHIALNFKKIFLSSVVRPMSRVGSIWMRKKALEKKPIFYGFAKRGKVFQKNGLIKKIR